MFFYAKYGVQTDFRFPMVKRGVVDLAATADWTPATGDTKVSKDGGSVANSTNNPAAVAGTGSVGWKVTLTATELTCAELNLQIVDSATKAVEDQFLTVYTYGNASAKIPLDLSISQTGDSFARLGAPIGASIAADIAAAATIAEFWAALTSSLTTSGSVGKLIVDNLNATVSSRSTYAGGDTAGTTTLLSRLGAALTITGGAVNVNDKTGFKLASDGLDTVAAPAQLANDAGGRASFMGHIAALYARFFNGPTQTATQQKVRNAAGTVISTMAASDDGTTQTLGKSV